ncbi:MAG: zinc-binding dehydrogenase [Acidimicrobiales bacterium]
MRALVVTAPGQVDLLDVAPPTPRADEVFVRPLIAGLCGTDLELIDGTIDAAYVRYPLTLGHEWVGRLQVARDRALVEGDAVVVEGVIPDGTCPACRRGATNLCATYDEIGFTRPGALGDLIAVPANLLHRLAPNVDLTDAALTEPMAVVWRALGRINGVAGARCLVVGDGTVALLGAYLLRRLAPASVDVLGARPAQAPLARAAGADRFLTTATADRYDVVVEAAGQGAAVQSALDAAARGATIVLLGLPPHGTRVAVAPDSLVNDDLTLQGSFSYTRSAFGDVVRLLNDGAVRPSFLATHRFALASWAEAIATLRAVPADQPRGKVLVDLTG